MKKNAIFILILVLFFGSVSAFAKKQKQEQKEPLPDSMAPALQFNLDDYKDYFRKSSDYEIKLKSRSKYKITCDSKILGVRWGDVENIKMFDVINDEEKNDMFSVYLKTKFETYSYIRLYKKDQTITNIIVNINPANEARSMNVGACTVKYIWR